MQHYKYRYSEYPDSLNNDIVYIQKALARLNYHISYIDIKHAWMHYSKSMDAGWIDPIDMSDMTIFGRIQPYIIFINEEN